MDNNITTKLQYLNCPADMYPRAYKHMASLETVSLEELEKILRLLLTEKIIVPKNGKILVDPADFCIFANGFDYIQRQIEEIKHVAHELDAYREKLVRINSKSAVNNIIAMKGMGEPYKNEEGKYSKVPFSYRRFQSKYGAPKEQPVVPKEEKKVESKPIPKEVVSEPKQKVVTIEDILKNPQAQALTDETFEEFETLMDSLQRIMLTVYGVDEVNDKITDNLIKLITSKKTLLAGKTDDHSLNAEILFMAITYGKNIPDVEKQRIRDSIDEELQYAQDMNVELGRAA